LSLHHAVLLIGGVSFKKVGHFFGRVALLFFFHRSVLSLHRAVLLIGGVSFKKVGHFFGRVALLFFFHRDVLSLHRAVLLIGRVFFKKVGHFFGTIALLLLFHRGVSGQNGQFLTSLVLSAESIGFVCLLCGHRLLLFACFYFFFALQFWKRRDFFFLVPMFSTKLPLS